MYRHQCNNGCRMMVWALCISLGSLVAGAVRADSMTPAALQPVSGGGQIGLLNRVFPLPLVVRVIAADGSPVAGASVHFEAPHCFNDGTICNVPEDYAYFPSHQIDVIAISDADGLATSPRITAGSIQDNLFQFSATVAPGTPSDPEIARVDLPVFQVVALDAVPITAGFTGSWYDPDQSGHGLALEVLSDNRVLVTWYTFTPDGTQQAWFGNVGQIIGNQALVNAYRTQGGRWIPEFDASQIQHRLWGTLTLVFSDCNHGRIYFESTDQPDGNWSNGSMDLTRLTLPAGLSCP